MKILIVEDDIHIRQGLVEALSREGYQLIAAENGKVALDKYRQEAPDFIILDIMMPELDGYSVCREIRKLDEQIPIVFLSAKDEELDQHISKLRKTIEPDPNNPQLIRTVHGMGYRYHTE